MKTILISTLLSLSIAAAQAQKSPVYGEAGAGFGQTLFFSGMPAALTSSLGGDFKPGTGNNLHMGFYASPERWRGLGLGSRIKGTFGAPVKGANGDDYIFNYYNVGISTRYHFSRQFNKGLFVRASLGFGQLTTKRLREEDKFYKHQFALGQTGSLSLGYVFPIGQTGKGIGVEAEFEASTRNGTINGEGDRTFRSGQIGGNVFYTF